MRKSFLLIIFLSQLLFCSNAIAQDKRIIIRKSQRVLQVYDGAKLIKEYNIALGRNPRGHKQREHDNKTPEGVYYISRKNDKSTFNKSLTISYPNKTDVARAASKGVSPGGNIAIHGIGGRGMSKLFQSNHWHKNWTKGCVAVTDKEINEIFKLTKVGTVVDIRP